MKVNNEKTVGKNHKQLWTLHLPTDLHRAAMAQAKLEGKPLAWFIRGFLVEWLERRSRGS